MRRTILIVAAVICCSVAGAQIDYRRNYHLSGQLLSEEDTTVTEDDYTDDYTVDDKGNVVVSTIIENIGASKADIYQSARRYIANAYRETKYEIVQDDKEQGIVTGRGKYLNFYADEKEIVFKFNNRTVGWWTYYVSAEFWLRVEAKDGRARISLYAQSYYGQLYKGKTTEQIDVRIADVAPVNENCTEDAGMYAAAFPLLIDRMKTTMADVEKALVEVDDVPADNGSEW